MPSDKNFKNNLCIYVSAKCFSYQYLLVQYPGNCGFYCPVMKTKILVLYSCFGHIITVTYIARINRKSIGLFFPENYID